MLVCCCWEIRLGMAQCVLIQLGLVFTIWDNFGNQFLWCTIFNYAISVMSCQQLPMEIYVEIWMVTQIVRVQRWGHQFPTHVIAMTNCSERFR